MLISKKATIEESGKTLCTGLTVDVLPAVQLSQQAEHLQKGVSTRNVPLPKVSKVLKKQAKEIPHWYALRVTYGREKKAHDYLVSKHIEAFCPMITTVKVVDGKQQKVKKSRLPNIFFARGMENELKQYVYDNINLPYLRFYYRHFHKGTQIIKEPLIVPDSQMESLRIICKSEAKDILLIPSVLQKFQVGQSVRIIDGAFKGVIGKVARYQGQQRVAVIIDGLFTIVSAYVPSAFLEQI